jgi:hypothetical protein
MSDGITPGTASSGSTVLEIRYRRILALLPRDYRERRGEEMLAVLLDGAGRTQAWPRPAQAASVAALAVRLRAGAPGGSRRAVFCGEVLRRVALACLLLQTLVFATFLIAGVGGLIQVWSRHFGAAAITMQLQALGILAALTFAPMAAFAALLAGRRRTGLTLSLPQLAGLAYACAAMPEYTVKSDYVVLLALACLATGSILLGFHLDAPRPASRRAWLAVAAVSVTVIAGAAVVAVSLEYDHAIRHYQDTQLLYRLSTLIFSPILPALAAGSALLAARRSALWPAAMTVLGLPWLALVPRNAILLDQGRADHMFPDLFDGSVWPYLGLECLLAEVVFASALLWSLRRSERRVALA